MNQEHKSLKLFQTLSDVKDSIIDESCSCSQKRKVIRRFAVSAAAIFALIIGSITIVPHFVKVDNGLQMKITYPKAYAFDSDKQIALIDQYPVQDGFISDINKFSYRTTSTLLQGKENVNYSPLSLYYALSVAASGSNGDTLKQFQQLLGQRDVKDLSLACNHLYRQLYRDNKVTKVKLANSLWVNRSDSLDVAFLKQSFISNTAHNFYASCHVVDFADSKSGKAMSQWVSDQTNHQLSPDITLNPKQVLSILNTVYFKGQWVDRFEPDKTKKDSFFSSSGEKVPCDFMNRTSQASFTKTNQYIKSAIPLKDGYSMVFVLPDKSSSVKELSSSPETLATIFDPKNTSFGEVTWQVPKMDFQSSLSLEDQLKSLGLTSPFSPTANFSNLTDGQLKISNVKQDTRITLDEDGVTASAFTKIEMDGSALPTDHAEMILNRPFLYAITSGNGCILFMGCYNQP